MTMGLTEYEAKLYVALVSMGDATASQASRVAQLPRSQVYGTAEGLEKKGWIEIRRGEPVMYRAIPPRKVLEKAKNEFEDARRDAATTLQHLEYSEGQHEELIWTLRGRSPILRQIQRMLDDARESVHIYNMEEYMENLKPQLDHLNPEIDITISPPENWIIDVGMVGVDQGDTLLVVKEHEVGVWTRSVGLNILIQHVIEDINKRKKA